MMKLQMRLLAVIVLTIVALYAFVPPPGPSKAQFGSQAAWGGTSTGSANSQTISLQNYNGDIGVPISFKAGFTNTAATTIIVSGFSASAQRPTNHGMQLLVGGEIIIGQVVTITFDGTFYQITMPKVEVGISAVFRSAGAPVAGTGWLIEDGRCVSKTDPLYVALFADIGDTYSGAGGCVGGNFGIPDNRGRMTAAIDNQGTLGAAGRITVGGSNCLGTTQSGCGSQASALTSVNQFPPYQPQGSVTQVNATGTVATSTTINGQGDLGGVYVPSTAAPSGFSTAAGFIRVQALSASSTSTFTGTNSGTGLFTGTTVGSSAPINTLSPVLLAFSAVKL